MEFILDVIMPEERLADMQIKEELRQWGDAWLPQEPRCFCWQGVKLLQAMQEPTYYAAWLKHEIIETDLILTVSDDAVCRLAAQLRAGECLAEIPLYCFLEQLEKETRAAVILLRDEEDVDCYSADLASARVWVCGSLLAEPMRGVCLDKL